MGQIYFFISAPAFKEDRVKTKLSAVINFAIAILLVLVSCKGFAGEIYDARVVGVYIDGNIIAARTEGGVVPVAQPSCATGNYPWVISLSSGNANGILSVLLTAKSTGEKIRIIGSGTCTINKENITYVMLVDGRT